MSIYIHTYMRGSHVLSLQQHTSIILQLRMKPPLSLLAIYSALKFTW
uniref:Uncharacterized protein n=1 Tax=Octopus bimaculoides TaxID=37653 RepID=A0A0L8HG29_OCTBM